MFKRLQHAIDILVGKYASIEDKLAEASRERAWLHTCLRGLLMQTQDNVLRVRSATQLRMTSCDQIWIDRSGNEDLIILLAQEKSVPPVRLVAAIRSR